MRVINIYLNIFQLFFFPTSPPNPKTISVYYSGFLVASTQKKIQDKLCDIYQRLQYMYTREEERDQGGRSNIKPGIVTDSRRQQCMIFIQNLWRYKKACWRNLYVQLLLPFLCLNYNLSLVLTSRIIGWSVNWQSDSTYFEQSCSNWIDFHHQRWFSSYKILFTLLNSRMVQLLEDKKSES